MWASESRFLKRPRNEAHVECGKARGVSGVPLGGEPAALNPWNRSTTHPWESVVFVALNSGEELAAAVGLRGHSGPGGLSGN